MLVAAAPCLGPALLGAPESGAAQFDSGTAGTARALGKARTVTLVTDDRVTLDATGQVTGVRPGNLDRRDAERPGYVRPEAGEAELGYMFLPEAWGFGYAAEACAAALHWFADALPGEPVALCTQTANDRSMRLTAKLGFTEVERFEEWVAGLRVVGGGGQDDDADDQPQHVDGQAPLAPRTRPAQRRQR